MPQSLKCPVDLSSGLELRAMSTALWSLTTKKKKNHFYKGEGPASSADPTTHVKITSHWIPPTRPPWESCDHMLKGPESLDHH